MELVAALALGFGAGVMGGMLGVGGGVLFVPALVLAFGLGQLESEATSLVAMVPVAVVGAWRQGRYGNLRLHDGLVLGAFGIGGAAAGVALANALPERTLRVAFAAVTVFTAFQLARRGLRRAEPEG